MVLIDSSNSLRLLALGLASAALAFGQPDDASAQGMVQPLPPASMGDLNTALTRLSRNARDVDALIDAGTASLDLGDIDAAIAFFGRADDLSPGNARVKVGLAGAFVRSERPLEALRLFEEAERAGASTVQLAVERGLAFDLVGDNANAQTQYRTAVSLRASDEAVRRLALSQAIAGDRAAFEATILPLLERRDLSGFRTRAFGLAILGEEAEAVSIAETVMPPALAAQIVPYLRFMPRLTRAQQAAAGNLGIFPRAAQIGRDDPRIASYAGSTAARPAAASGDAVRLADARLAPAGRALGTPAATPTATTAAGTATVSPAATAAQTEQLPEPRAKRPNRRIRTARAQRDNSGDRMSAARARARQRIERVAPIRETNADQDGRLVVLDGVSSLPAPGANTRSPADTTPIPIPVPSVSGPDGPALARGELPALGANGTATGSIAEPSIVPATPPVSSAVAVVQTIPANTGVAAAARPGFTADVVPSTVAPAARAPVSLPPPEPASLAEAFAAFATPKPATAPQGSGVVDMATIEPAREAAPVEQAAAERSEPALPTNPSRIWVQVATGKDRTALRYDWRQMLRKAPDTLNGFAPHVATWGQTNRLLAGPYENAAAARAAGAALGEAGIDSFRFTSKAGEEIERLQ